ncbi:family 43 glycosylhydrolase [Flavivirga spongiicola]|uniref:Family 43 glycosylhydrolase n=1 Tax=Flavivirga spongiicola TaxID=421621 RepID=A0ABU7XNT7_9FLAO|nr:family 43 glycosylhydrolase [Flavivirga sp. MEBiC05379]MDO5977421.1 family 43 glycosylhydrolase [Flavivirga sp. MEBiC05379]
MKNSNLILIIMTLLVSNSCKKYQQEEKASDIKEEVLKTVAYKYTNLTNIGAEQGITRRDPSDIIFANNQYYIWYTKTDKGFSGYNASIWYAISKDGISWEEKGEAIPKGTQGTWDAFSVFTPNVLKANNKYYLFYTGVKSTPGNPDGNFENNAINDITALGLMVSDSPEGPFVKVSNKPILEISNNEDDFDSYRIDDACILYRNKKYWLYYKGRSSKYGVDGPKHTKMGVAIADKPDGPYLKYEKNPITNGGHEVMVWPYKEGVMTMLSNHGAEGRTLQYAKDGVNFSIIGKIADEYPKAPGYFRFDDFKGEKNQRENIKWGISMIYGDTANNIWPYLIRYEIEIKD